eukprot:gene6794-10958_t
MSLTRAFDTWIDPLWVTSWSSWKPLSSEINLDMDIRETDKEYQLSAEVPGINKEDLTVDYEGSNLTVAGEKSQRKETKDMRSHIVERSYGNFKRTLRFPENACFDKLKAKYENGVLDIHIPKAETPKPKTSKVTIE